LGRANVNTGWVGRVVNRVPVRQHFVDFVMRIFARSTKCWL
jgi:hypothetical protein